MVKYISDRIGVLHKGFLVETGTTQDIFENPMHPYTKSLLSAVPIPDPIVEKSRRVVNYDSSSVNYENCELKKISDTHFVMM